MELCDIRFPVLLHNDNGDWLQVIVQSLHHISNTGEWERERGRLGKWVGT